MLPQTDTHSGHTYITPLFLYRGLKINEDREIRTHFIAKTLTRYSDLSFSHSPIQFSFLPDYDKGQKKIMIFDRRFMLNIYLTNMCRNSLKHSRICNASA